MDEELIGDGEGIGDHEIGYDDDEVIGAIARRMGGRRFRIPAPGGRLARLPPTPAWRRGMVAPGVHLPREAREMLPLTPSANNGVFDSATPSINFVGRPQKPFRASRFIATVRRSAGAGAVIIRAATIIVGTDNNLVQIANFDVEFFAGNNFGVGLKMTPAQPGIEISVPCSVSVAVPPGESVSVNLAMIGACEV